jgi:hypothetical protein
MHVTNVMRIGGAIATGVAFTGVLGAASGMSIKEPQHDGISGRDLAVTGVGVGVLGAVGVGLGALLAASPSTGVNLSSRMGMLIGGGAAAAVAASYLIGWSLTN